VKLKIFILAGAMILVMPFIQPCQAAPVAVTDVPPEVNAAASNGLPVFLAKVPPDSKQQYGFPDNADFSKVHLGSPLLLQTIRPSDLSSNQTSGTVSSVVSDTSMWFFPVLMGAEAKSMLVVDRLGNEWKAVSLGYAPLAGEWNQVLHQWPAASGYHPKLIAVFQARRFYFTVPELGDRNLTPLFSPGDTRIPTNVSVLGLEQNSFRYAALGTSSSEMSKLRSFFERADLNPGR
jgi:hypothetical protein